MGGRRWSWRSLAKPQRKFVSSFRHHLASMKRVRSNTLDIPEAKKARVLDTPSGPVFRLQQAKCLKGVMHGRPLPICCGCVQRRGTDECRNLNSRETAENEYRYPVEIPKRYALKPYTWPTVFSDDDGAKVRPCVLWVKYAELVCDRRRCRRCHRREC